MPDRPTEQDVIQALEAYDREKLERVRQLLREQGRPDLVTELDAHLKLISSGVDGARGIWHALSRTQRTALGVLYRGYKLARQDYATRYVCFVPPARRGLPVGVFTCFLPTVRNLIARSLVDLGGGVFDPEKVVVISERGRFCVPARERSAGMTPEKELDYLRRAVAFVALWCYRTARVDEAERLDVIRYHPAVQAAAKDLGLIQK